MDRHISYLGYLLRHKFWVAVAARKVKCSWWRVLVHDLSKFMPCEWYPYAETFYNHDGSKRYKESPEFHNAWLHHQKWNKHHWQYWLLYLDRGEILTVNMPDTYIKEMVADWMGAGRAITGKWEVLEWYEKNKDNIKLSEQTRAEVEGLLYWVEDNS